LEETLNSILFVQNGDFAQAYHRISEGSPETYRDQAASVNFVAGLAPRARVTTFAFGTDQSLINLAPELWATGGPRQAFEAEQISTLFDEAEVTHLVLRTPHLGFLHEAARRKIPALPCFADIFNRRGLRCRYWNWKLRQVLLKCNSPCFSNHSLNASRSMMEVLRLPSQKIVPWDWSKVPVTSEAKSGVHYPDQPSAFFAGTLSEDKGVGDCLDAISLLRTDGLRLTMSFAGPGKTSQWQERAEHLGIADQVSFLGVIPNTQVRAQMHEHDFVIVPSRHSYPEGLPNTIYEGLASRSALIISDHPAFASRLQPDAECLVFPAMDSPAIASSLKRLILNPALYKRLSENAVAALDRLYVGMEWTTMVTAFLNDPENQTGWVENNSLQTLAE
jgi:glycosyltransferase involved in cell wall biosynthesis